MPTRPFDAGIRSSGISSPVIRSASSAPRRNVSDGPVDLDQRVADRLAGLERDQPAELLATRLDAGADLAQDRGRARRRAASRVTSNAATAASTASSYCSSVALYVAPAGCVGVGRVGDLEQVGRVDPAAGEEDRMRLGAGGEGHRAAPVVTVRCGIVPRPTIGRHDARATRPPCARSRPPARALRVKPGTRVRPREHRSRRDARRDKAAAEPRRQTGLERLASLQDRLWAEAQAIRPGRPPGHRRRRQGRHDQHVMTAFNPQGCPVTSFKVPTHRGARPRLPVARPPARARARARSAIFNRSHYEDVLVVRVHDLVPEGGLVEALRPDQRLRAAARPTNGTTVVKFFLPIDKDEQRERFQARYDDPTKRWKFSMGDLEERKLWDDYQAAFEDALSKTLDRRGAVVRHPGRTASGSATWPWRRSWPTRSPT